MEMNVLHPVIADDHHWNENLMRSIRQQAGNRKLHFMNMNLIDKDMRIIVDEGIINEASSELHLQSNRLTSEGVQILMRIFQQNVFIQLLDLSYNRIKDEGVHHLCEALRHHHQLKSLRLGTNAITDTGAEYLSRFLLENNQLSLLELSSNELTSSGLITLARSVPHTSLNYFYVDQNSKINDDCVDALVLMIREAKSLRSISMIDTDFSSKTKEKLRKLVQTKHSTFLSV